uniref:Uncharacterized protein n=1 Tax=Anguilla anguilla TaxID=7936 RepID=A0A0E9QMQ9_ANGAN
MTIMDKYCHKKINDKHFSFVKLIKFSYITPFKTTNNVSYLYGSH